LDAFEAAKTKNRIILVNVGMEGCAACGRMEDLTYADSEVINIISEHFVAIEVDAEARTISRSRQAGHVYLQPGYVLAADRRPGRSCRSRDRFSRTGYVGTGELIAGISASTRATSLSALTGRPRSDEESD
jgi:hypothetical protein